MTPPVDTRVATTPLRTRPPRAAAIAWALCLGAAACGGDSDPGDASPTGNWTRAYTLDPRLEDGRPSADVLASIQETVETTEFTDPDPDTFGPWGLIGGTVNRNRATGGVNFLGDSDSSSNVGRISLVHPDPIEAHKVDTLEMVLSRVPKGDTFVRWKSSEVEGPERGGQHFMLVGHDSIGNEIEPVRVNLSNHPGWRGTITAFTVSPIRTKPQRFTLQSIQFVREGFALGSERLGEEFGDRPFADGGLVALGREARRTWPTDWNVPLVHENLQLPNHACFEASIALPFAGAEEIDEFRVAVDVLPIGGSDWINAESRIASVDEEAPSPWQTVHADLSAWSGEQVDVRIRCERVEFDVEQEAIPEARRGSVFWSAPRVLEGETAQTKAPPSVLLVTLDTSRADAWSGDAAPTRMAHTPFLDSLHADSSVYVNSWSACNATTPSHASILTGISLQDHGVLTNWSTLAPANVTLSELFRAQGYETAAAVSVSHLQAGNSGLGQGFDRFLLADENSSMDGASTVERALEWIDEWHGDGDRPFFLWVHLFDPHAPYQPPADFLDNYARDSGIGMPPKTSATNDEGATATYKKEGYLAGVTNGDYIRWLYSAGVTYSDHLTARLWSRMREHELDETTTLVITSDHGEALGEHGSWCDHADLLEKVMQVPLLIRVAGGQAPQRVDELVWSLDIAPTLCQLHGISPPPGLRGLSLLGTEDQVPADRLLWFEKIHGTHVGARDNEHHYVRSLRGSKAAQPYEPNGAGARVLFDHRVDPQLLSDTSESDPTTLARFDRAFDDFRSSALERESMERALSEAEAEALRNLGYLEAEPEKDE